MRRRTHRRRQTPASRRSIRRCAGSQVICLVRALQDDEREERPGVPTQEADQSRGSEREESAAHERIGVQEGSSLARFRAERGDEQARRKHVWTRPRDEARVHGEHQHRLQRIQVVAKGRHCCSRGDAREQRQRKALGPIAAGNEVMREATTRDITLHEHDANTRSHRRASLLQS